MKGVGGGAYSFVACRSHFTIEYASLSRRSRREGGGEVTLDRLWFGASVTRNEERHLGSRSVLFLHTPFCFWSLLFFFEVLRCTASFFGVSCVGRAEVLRTR